MTTPDHSALDRARDWSAAVTAVLDDVATRVSDVVRHVERGRPDDRGGEWTERLLRLQRDLQRDADAAADLRRSIDRVADESDDAMAADAPASFGPRLGSTDARHADDRRGVRIPRLSDTDDGG